jgi:hypothetical protein
VRSLRGRGLSGFLTLRVLVSRGEREEIYPGDFSTSGGMHWLLPFIVDNQQAHELAQQDSEKNFLTTF